MTLDKTIEQLEKLQEMILESSEWVFGDEKTDYQYVKALRNAIDALPQKVRLDEWEAKYIIERLLEEDERLEDIKDKENIGDVEA